MPLDPFGGPFPFHTINTLRFPRRPLVDNLVIEATRPLSATYKLLSFERRGRRKEHPTVASNKRTCEDETACENPLERH